MTVRFGPVPASIRESLEVADTSRFEKFDWGILFEAKDWNQATELILTSH